MTTYLDLKMPDPVFNRFARFIQTTCGIKMPHTKKIMLESRLKKRLRSLNLSSFEEYEDLVFGRGGQHDEVDLMIDAVTTNKTDFFREPEHFEFLRKSALQELLDYYGWGIRKPVRVWSAGCSTGEEAYALAMVLNEFAEQTAGYRYTVLGTDISASVLETARRGVYQERLIDPVPDQLKRKYFMRSRDRDLGLVRVVPELRSNVNYRRLNLVERDFKLDGTFEILFCRNVLIYFEKKTQDVLLNKLFDHLQSGGYLFLGHSETLHNFDLPFRQVRPMVYRRQD